jgi:Na+/melibiose symporter-like transporter
MIPVAIIYTFLSFLVAFFGRNRKFGFWIYFVLCFIFTPVVTLVIVLASAKRVVLAKVEDAAPVTAPAQAPTGA